MSASVPKLASAAPEVHPVTGELGEAKDRDCPPLQFRVENTTKTGNSQRKIVVLTSALWGKFFKEMYIILLASGTANATLH